MPQGVRLQVVIGYLGNLTYNAEQDSLRKSEILVLQLVFLDKNLKSSYTIGQR